MSGGATSAPAERKLILVVDDDPNIRTIIARALSPTYDIRQAGDGLAAADELAKLPTPDLIILDVMMPQADGLTFATAAKANPKFKTIPILFLTARTSPADIVKGIQAGARGYLTKPFKIEALREKVAKVLG
jgi:two-component system OmpR family response regulator